MKKQKVDGFTCFVFLLISLSVFFMIQLLHGVKEEQKPYTALIPLGDFQYDSDFLDKISKITGIQEIWPVVEIPVTIKIDDYTKSCIFSGIDFDAFTTNPGYNVYGNTPILIFGRRVLENMKDSNGHIISKKQQEKYLEEGTKLEITYSIENAENTLSVDEASYVLPQNVFLPCTVAAILTEEEEQIYLPLSQAQMLCSKNGIPMNVSKVLMKIKGKENLEKARELFEETLS